METRTTYYVSLESLSAEFRLPQRYLRDLARQKKIPCLIVAGRLRFNSRAVASALDELAVQGADHEER